jgi:hypothetical protein
VKKRGWDREEKGDGIRVKDGERKRIGEGEWGKGKEKGEG